MATWVSVLGKWQPAKEYVVDGRAPRGSEIYEGPDREALLYLKANGMLDENGNIIDTPGTDYRMNQDTLQLARTLGYKDVDDFLINFKNIDPKVLKEKSEKLLGSKTNEHKPNPRKPAAKIEGGGTDTSGQGNDRYGAFGKPEDVPSIAAKMKD